jgi:hypothetical protein
LRVRSSVPMKAVWAIVIGMVATAVSAGFAQQTYATASGAVSVRKVPMLDHDSSATTSGVCGVMTGYDDYACTSYDTGAECPIGSCCNLSGTSGALFNCNPPSGSIVFSAASGNVTLTCYPYSTSCSGTIGWYANAYEDVCYSWTPPIMNGFNFVTLSVSSC